MSVKQTKMQVMALNSCGPDFDLHMAEQAMPVPKDNELLVAIEYVALNHLDARLAKTGFEQWQYPHILGLDAVGTVVDAPRGVFPGKGSRVLFNSNLAEPGMLKEYAVVPNYSVSEIPDNMPGDVAVVLPNAGMAALLAIEKLQIQPGDALAVNSAQGAVAHFAIQYGKQKGAKVFAFAQQAHHKRLRDLGADFVFDCEASNVCDQIKHELGGSGFDCILNTQGAESFNKDIERLRFCGRIACLNGFSNVPEDLLFQKAPNIGVVSIAGAWLANSLCAQQHLRFMGEKLLSDVSSGQIQAPLIKHVDFNVEAVKSTLEMLLSRTCQERPVVKISK